MPQSPGQRIVHRILWVVFHPLITWGMSAYVFFAYPSFKELQAATLLLLMFFPLALYLRWQEADRDRARTYGLSVAIALGGVSLAGAYLFLLFQGIGPPSSWR